MASNGEASHKAIWDDSALVDSWSDAVEEYKVCDLKTGIGKTDRQIPTEVSQHQGSRRKHP
jgi:hypothetical protein